MNKGKCGADVCHRISTENEAIAFINWFGQHQPKEDAICPRCGELMPGKTSTHALSRWADIMVCDHCGGIEALEQAGLVPRKPLNEWHTVKTRKGNEMSKQREAQKNAVITKWLGEDKFFHCQACGQIVRAVLEDVAWRFPVDIVLEADQRYGTCLCAECLQERNGEIRNGI